MNCAERKRRLPAIQMNAMRLWRSSNTSAQIHVASGSSFLPVRTYCGLISTQVMSGSWS